MMVFNLATLVLLQRVAWNGKREESIAFDKGKGRDGTERMSENKVIKTVNNESKARRWGKQINNK